MKGRDGSGWDDRRTMLKHKQMTDYGPWMKGQTDVEMEVEIVFSFLSSHNETLLSMAA